MRRLVLLVSILLISTFFFAQTPLPAIHTHPVWEVAWTSLGGQTGTDVFTYGEVFFRCEKEYVAVIRNDTETILYLRMDAERVYYLIDIDNCEEEFLLYDYSDAADIIIPAFIDSNDNLQEIDVTHIANYQGALLGGEVKEVEYSFMAGPFPSITTSFWFRGVGDIIHPFFPLFNNLSLNETIFYTLRSLSVNHMLWYCDATLDCNNNIIYVDIDVTDGLQDGSSWANAFSSLEGALNSADAGDILWVAEGEYKLNDDDRLNAFVLRDSIAIYGGFAGDELYFAERVPDMHPTVLSGDIGVANDSTDNSYHILRIQDAYNYAIVDGLQIQDGNAIGGNIGFPFVEDGAGILLYAAFEITDTAEIILNNLALLENTARNGAAFAFDDGYCVSTKLMISDSRFFNNKAQRRGGAIAIPFSSGQQKDMEVYDCSFERNESFMGGGGAIFDENDRCNWSIIKSSFAFNKTIFGGGGGIEINQQNGTKSLFVSNTNFSDNQCTGDGGAIDIANIEGTTNVDFYLEYCSFNENQSIGNSGGGIFIGSLDPFTLNFHAQECSFINNRALTRGGSLAVFTDGAGGNGNIQINRCHFTGNSCGDNIGGGLRLVVATPNDNIVTNRLFHIAVDNSLFAGNTGAISQSAVGLESAVQSVIRNCTIVDNGITPFVKNYFPDFNDDTFFNNMHLKNSIIWEPESPIGAILYNGDPDDLSLFDYQLDHCIISADNCDLPGGGDACESNLNFFNSNPLFIDEAAENYRLAGCSPGLNAGVFLEDIGSVDLDGNQRVTEEVIDLGAYENTSINLVVDSLIEMVDCYGDSTAFISLGSTGGAAPLTFSLIGEYGEVQNDSGFFNNLSAGNYTLMIEDFVGCTDSVTVQITEPEVLQLYSTIENYLQGQQGGSIIIDSIIGGTMPYELVFEEVLLMNEEINGLLAGSYNLLIEDSLGCTIDTLLEVMLIDKTISPHYSKDVLELYPNPVSSHQIFSLKLNSETNAQSLYVKLINIEGKLLSTYLLTEANNKVESPNVNGIYFIILQNAEKQILAIKKLIVN